jgi:hypothetical protein
MLKENITANLINKLKIIEIFNWSTPKVNTLSEEIGISIAINRNDPAFDSVGEGRFTTAIIEQYITQIQRKLCQTIYDSAEKAGFVFSHINGVISFEYKDILRDLDIRLAYETREADFIITNAQIGSYLQDSMYYTPDARIRNGSAGIIDVVGRWNNIPLYVDPYINYFDTRILFGKKSSILELSVVDASVTDDKVEIRGGYNLHEVGKLKELSVIVNEEQYNEMKSVSRELALIKMGI